ncbi:pentapeptide repeat-containing protein [Streptomyces sp. TRM 70351]|nr:pentapeptide repeat-containing protein [Streptomyces sp. TRM 70351]MEE1930899.1 pentapeptide repeat-containing protein [Streptomyces sp. TRM 70351]
MTAVGAAFHGVHCVDSAFSGADLRGADLTGAWLREVVFRADVDESTRFTGMHGSVYGPLSANRGDSVVTMGGETMREWLRDRGARAEVIPPRGP